MKVAERILNVEGTMGSVETVGMTIESSAMAHIMGILTDLYADPEMAVLREYATNARDSHVEAGTKRPIEISLPTQLTPVLQIRDYGVGLDADDIRETYSRYGASTKRDTNEAVGMLGLGCKSGLAYADQFIVTGIKDGVRTEVVVTRQADGTGGMQIPVVTETDEPNGVTITIPAQMNNEFEDKAAELFRYWDEGTVLVNGQVPARIDGLWIADDMLLTRETDDAMIVVMGGVPYPVPGEYRLDGEMNLVAFVDIGEVNFAPSREALMMTDLSKAKVAELKEREVNERQAALVKLVEEAESAHEAARVAQEANAMGLKGDATWKGEDVPLRIKRPEGNKMFVVPAQKRYKSRGFEPTNGIPTYATSRAILVGLTVDNFTPYKRQKFDQWLGKQTFEEGKAPKEYIVVDSLPADQLKWIDPATVLDWADVEAEKIAKAGASNGGPRGSVVGTYDVFTPDGYKQKFPADEIPVGSVYYFQGKGGYDPDHHQGSQLVREDSKDKDGNVTAWIVVLPGNRVEKFKRDFKRAKPLGEAARTLAQKFVDGLTADDKLKLVAHNNRRIPSVIRDLDAAKVDDPEIHAVLAACQDSYELTAKVNNLSAWARPDLSDVEVPDLKAKYPLLEQLYNHRVSPHLYLYLNAAYAASLEEAAAAADDNDGEDA